MKCWSCILILFFLVSTSSAQSNFRIESEYKLDVPNEEADILWAYISNETLLEKMNFQGDLNSTVSIEQFLDVYFDDSESNLNHQKVGLRYRKRFVDNVLQKTLIQLKTPIEIDGVARNEIKFDVKKSTDCDDLLARHPLLKYVKKKNREELDYLLRKFDVTSKSMSQSISLTQTRKRLYIKDSISDLATITLDYVRNNSFPFQKYTELELELNEVRYTYSSDDAKNEMEIFNNSLKQELIKRFPNLNQDQTPKYSKLMILVENSWLSFIYENWMWIVWIGISFFAGLKMIS